MTQEAPVRHAGQQVVSEENLMIFNMENENSSRTCTETLNN